MSVYGKVVSHGATNKATVAPANKVDDDEWETDPDYVVTMSEKEQRKGATSGAARAVRPLPVNVDQVRAQAKKQDETVSKQQFEKNATRYAVPIKDDANLRQNMPKTAVNVEAPKPKTGPSGPVVPTATERQQFWDKQNAEDQKKRTTGTKVDIQTGSATSKKSLFEQKAAEAAPAQPQVHSTGKKWAPPAYAAKPAPAAAPAPSSASGAPKWKPPPAGGAPPPAKSSPAPPSGGPPKAAPPVPSGGPPKAAPPMPSGGPPKAPPAAPPPAPPPADDDWGQPAAEPANDDWGQPPQQEEAPQDDWSQQQEAAPAQDDWSQQPPQQDDWGQQPPQQDDWSQQQEQEAPAQDDWGQQAPAEEAPQEDWGQPAQQEQPQDDWGGGNVGSGGEPQVRALYDFAAEADGDLSFSAGDTLTIIDDSDPSGWWQGRDSAGNTGAFPSNLVERI